MTFSISARCARTGMFGIAVSSSSPAVAARCAHARANVGVVASQNITDPTLGTAGLDLMESGCSASEALAKLTARENIDYRQLALVDAQGRTAMFSGRRVLGTYATAEGDGVVAAGNMLADRNVPQKMIEAFEADDGHHVDRLLLAMSAGLAAGGEEGPVHSAGLLLVRDVAWPIVDLRVDWSDDGPIEELAALWRRYRPQMEDYVKRALDPTAAPSFGVPGDR